MTPRVTQERWLLNNLLNDVTFTQHVNVTLPHIIIVTLSRITITPHMEKSQILLTHLQFPRWSVSFRVRCRRTFYLQEVPGGVYTEEMVEFLLCLSHIRSGAAEENIVLFYYYYYFNSWNSSVVLFTQTSAAVGREEEMCDLLLQRLTCLQCA